VALPERLGALLEVESGLNDPMSIFLTVLLVHVIADPAWISVGHAARLFVEEMAGGAILGLGGGCVLAWGLRRLPIEASLSMVLALTSALALFGLAQSLGASGFLAVYLAGVVTGAAAPRQREDLKRFFDGIAWLSQIVLFLMLGLLVQPRSFPPYFIPAIAATAILIFIARPVAVFACLLPFRFGLRETTFASWVGLRGAVPIYLSILPALADPRRDTAFFAGIFMLVVASLVVQGWTVAPAARLLGFRDAS
jgi:cell volume regulation protein A